MWGNKHKKLAVALVCGDWRLHHTKSEINRRLRRAMRVDGVDYITVPGPDGLRRPERATEWASALEEIKFYVGAHSPISLAVLAHQRCAGHPVSDESHVADVVLTAEALKSETGFAGKVAALVAEYHSDFHWTLRLIKQF